MSALNSTKPIGPPSAWLALTDLPRALGEFAALPLAQPVLASAPRGDGHAVLVLPGFMTTDASTGAMRRFLRSKGYDVHGWELGRNLGPRAIGREGEKLIGRLRHLHETTGAKVSLVGWSLGGVMARIIARRVPEAVRQVISLGSPIAGSPKATSIWRAYELLTGQKVDDPDTQAQLSQSASPAPVPSTAIYSKEDGIVAWQICKEPRSDNTDNIEVHGSHCGLGINAAALYAVADRLAQPEDNWHPFQRTGLKAWAYPSAGHA